MIYSGQEMPNKKRIKFFDKDPIQWSEDFKLQGFYQTLLYLRKNNSALRAGDENATTKIISTEYNDRIFVFLRNNGNDEIMVFLNFSADILTLEMTDVPGKFIDVFSKTPFNSSITVEGWGFKVFEKTSL